MALSVLHLDESVSAALGVSPGVVNGSEVLLREMFEPYHFHGGVLQKTAVSLRELRSTGFSVHRKEHVTYAHVRNAIDERLSRPRKSVAWKSKGVAVILTSDVRNLVDSDQDRLCVVIDTALNENPGHASIYAADPDKGEAYARKVRSYLMPLLEDLKPAEAIFGQP